MTSVQVVVRLRPMNSREVSEGTLPVITASTSNNSVTVIKGVGSKQARSQFTFDNVFTSFSTQKDVFTKTLCPVISDVLKGFETCVFAYGQTGTGKTHTMEGNLDDSEQFGVIPRAAQAIFDALQQAIYHEAKVSCSFLEIYNEELSDLLASDHSTKLDIVQGGKGGVHCRGLSHHPVHSPLQVLQLMRGAALTRRVGETSMNKLSSRSHCIFTIYVDVKQILSDGSMLDSQGKLHMVDLAGSESAKTATLEQSSAKDQATREQERRNINKSLLTLGRVISMLKEQTESKGKAALIPYRDSKLTRILQEALGGRCKTVIIATISPSILNVQESLQTLHYAQTANGIRNKPTSNSYMSMTCSLTSLGFTPESSMTVGAERWQEMEIRMEHMQQEVEEARQALARNYMKQQEVEERAEKAEAERSVLQNEVNDLRLNLATRTDQLESMENLARELEDKLLDSQRTLEKTKIVLKATQESEHALTREASALLRALKDSIEDGTKLHKLLQASREDELQRRSLTRDFNSTISNIVANTVAVLDKVVMETNESQCVIRETLLADQTHHIAMIEEARTLVTKMSETVSDMSVQVNTIAATEITPQLSLLVERINHLVENTFSIAHSRDEVIARHCLLGKNELMAFGKSITECSMNLDCFFNESLSEIQKLVLASKMRIETMVKDLEMAISVAQSNCQSTRISVNNVLKDWKDEGVVTITRIIEKSDEQKAALGENYNLLNEDKSRHKSVNTVLKKQLECLCSGKTTQSDALHHQREKLNYQQRVLKESKERQEALCATVIGTINDQVKQIVDEQVKRILADQSTTVTELLSNSSSIEGMNDALENVSNDLFEELKSSNLRLINDINALQESNASGILVLGSIGSGISSVKERALEHEVSIREFSLAANEQLQGMANAQKDIEVAVSGMKIAAHACAEHIDVGFNVADSMISNSARMSSEVISISRDAAQKLTSTLSDIDEPRSNLMVVFSDHLGQIKDAAEEGRSQVSRIVKNQSEAIINASSSTLHSAEDFVSTACDQHLMQSALSQDKLNTLLKSQKDESQFKLLGCRDEVVGIGNKTRVFGDSVIKMSDPIDPGPSMNTIQFSENLTSTPTEDILLAGFDLEKENDPLFNVSHSNATFPCEVDSGVLCETPCANKTSKDGTSPRKRRRVDSSSLPRRTKTK